MTQTIRFGNHDLEIRSDDSSFTESNIPNFMFPKAHRVLDTT